MALPTALSFLGLGKETVRGIGVVPTVYIPLKTITPQDVIDELPVEVLTGSMAKEIDVIQGYKWTILDVGGPVFPDTIPWFLAGALGDITSVTSRTVADAVTNSTTLVTSATAAFTAIDFGRPISGTNIPAGATIVAVISATNITISANATGTGSALSITIGAASLFSHAMAVKNSGDAQPTSHTGTDFYGVTQARQYAGLQWHEVNIKFSGKLLEHTCKATGLVSSLPVAKPTVSLSTVLPIPQWQGSVQVGGSAILTMESGEFMVQRTVEVVKALTGTQQPSQIFIGDAIATGKFTAIMNDDTELTRYLVGGAVSFDILWTTGVGAALTSLEFHTSKAKYTLGKIVRGQGHVTVDIEFKALGNVTDAGASGGYNPAKFIAQNLVAAGTYI
jgi:Phage tail tube protein